MSDSPDRYIFGIEKPVLPVILAAIALPTMLIGFAITLGIWWWR
ncbi:hypothetical protein [Mycolicibacterium brisbanense]